LLGELYDVLESRRREAELARAIELPAVEILDQASLPLKPASPSLPRNLALALLLGTLLGSTHGLIREVSDRRVRDPRTLEQDMGVTVLSAIPSGAGTQLLFRPPNGNGRRAQTRLLGRSRLAEESFRGLVTDLDHLLRRATDQQLETIAVVSPGPDDDGRVLAACNLALARSSMGLPSALIDADLQAGEASKALGFGSAVGLQELLTGQARLSEVVRHTSISSAPGAASQSMAFLPAGARSSMSAELVRRSLLADILGSMVNRYGFVVINTPPAALLSDAYAIAAAVDGVVFVARSGVTDQEQLRDTIDRVRRVGARIVGLILMDADASVIPSARDASGALS